MPFKQGELLSRIQDPSDLRKLEVTQLHQLCKELRAFIVDHVSVYGGHLGASLGVIELTVALHYVFHTPEDRLVWDVGHQAYGHKILTGRRDVFHTNRQFNGISGFPRRTESEYDTFGVGHSSTSISAALGMVVASAYFDRPDQQHIAVIGDGALTAGMAFEALNHAGSFPNNILIILNDNGISIDSNVGALKDYLTRITTSTTYNRAKEDIWNILGKLSSFGKSAQEVVSHVETGVKSILLTHSNLFESLNLRYFGPVNGHDINDLLTVLAQLKKIKGPKLLHCRTVKGKGYEPAENGNATTWHAPGLFNTVTGKIHQPASTQHNPPKYQDVFGHTLLELARANEAIVGITPAMPTGSSMNIMMKEMPDRTFDVGIAEQHAVTFSAGMATQGLIPFCNIYSSFMQRAYDQVVHDVCIQNLPVNFCLDRAGFAGSDGATHHGAYDLAYFRCVPNMIVAAPMNEQELRNLMYTAQLPRSERAFSIRYPRGEGVMINWRTPFQAVPIGSGRKIIDGAELAILTIGHVGNFAQEAIKRLHEKSIFPALYDMRFVKPLDVELLHEIATQYEHIITVEDGCIAGGFGSAVLEFMADHDYSMKIHRLGIPDQVIEQGKQDELQALCGFDAAGIERAVVTTYEKRFQEKKTNPNR